MQPTLVTAFGEVCRGVSVSVQNPLRCQETVYSYRAACVNSSRGNADLEKKDIVGIKFLSFEISSRISSYLRTKAKSITIGESGARVVENASAVDLPLKVHRFLVVLRNDHVRMRAPVLVDVSYSVFDV